MYGNYVVAGGAPGYPVEMNAVTWRFDGAEWVNDYKSGSEAKSVDMTARFAVIASQKSADDWIQVVQIAP